MLFWTVAAVMALAVLATVLAPLWRGAPGGDPRAQDQAIYRDQLAEVDRDLARGVIAPDEAERARVEIARRLLAADKAGVAPLAEGPRSRLLALGLGGAALAGALAGYWALGAPGYPDLPLAQRLAAAEERFRNLLPQEQAEAMAAPAMGAQRIEAPADIQATVAEVRAFLDENPDDLPTLILLRDFAVGTRDWPEAARLQSRIVAVLGFDVTPGDLIAEVDLLVAAAGGIVSAEARARLDVLAQMTPDSPAIGWFMGLMAEQVGRPDLAFAAWRPLAEEGDEGSPFTGRARGAIERAAFLAGTDYVLPPLNAPTADQVAAAGEMSPEDQQAMIEGMVAGLAARLATDGGPAADWARLIAAYGVLGQTDQARAIWTEAQQVFAADPIGMGIVGAAAIEAGVAD